MKVGVFSIVHLIRDDHQSARGLEGIKRTLEGKGIRLRYPKLGTHITLIPPFRTDEDAAKLLAWGYNYNHMMDIGIPSLSHPGWLAQGTGYDFFRNEDVDAFIVRMSVGNLIAHAVEQWRAQIPQIASWVYPPEGHAYTPHVTVGKGKGVADVIEPLIKSGEIPINHATDFSFELRSPQVMRETEGGKWERVF
jgi:2'-5' RNA ligase